MGNQVTFIPPKEEGLHVEHQIRFLTEYQQTPFNDLKEDLKRWESVEDTISNMRIEEQSEYADYVTRKICEMDPEIVTSSGESLAKQFAWTLENSFQMTACSIANAAKTILSQTNEELKTSLLNQFHEVLQLQRDLRNKPSISEQINNVDVNNPDAFGDTMKSITTNLMQKMHTHINDPNAQPEDMVRGIFKEILRPDQQGQLDEIMLKVKIQQFLQEKINEGLKLEQAILLTSQNFKVPPGTQAKITMTINFDDYIDFDDESSD